VISIPIRILITGDNHLENKSENYGSRRRDRQEDFQKSFEAIIEYALNNEIDLFLICGDLFDGRRPSNSISAWAMRQFRALSEKGIKAFAVTGHHDTPRSIVTGVSPLKTHGDSGHITYLSNPSAPEPYDLQIDGKSVRVVGVGFNPSLRPDDDPLDVEIPGAEGDLNILLLHYPIVGLSGFVGDEARIRIDSLPKGYQLIAGGHFHTAQEKKTKGSLITIPGSSERVNFREEDGEKSFSVVTVDNEMEMTVEKVSLKCREMKTLIIKVKNGDDINKKVEEEIRKTANPELILRVRIEGRITPETLATYRKTPLQRLGDELCFKLLLDDMDSLHVSGLRDIEPIASTNPNDELLSYFDKRMEDLDDDSKRVVEHAKELCIQLLEEVTTE